MTEASHRSDRFVSAAAVTASGTALACTICCVLPFALPAAVLGATGGLLAWFAHAYRWMAPIALFAVVAAWAWVSWLSWSTRKRLAQRTILVLGLSTLMLAFALLWPFLEEPLMHFLKG